MLGAKSSSVFPVPCRAAVYADDYGLACAENQAHYGKKISRQAWNICPKIREMNQFLQDNSGSPGIVGESHPELVFAMLAGKVLISSKKSEIGIRQRLATLGRYKGGGADVYDAALDKYLRKDVARDDVVDAMALQIAAENAVELNLNEQQQTGDGGIRVEMHVPSQASLLSSPDYI
jgi:predicted RNase H-like nuclease